MKSNIISFAIILFSLAFTHAVWAGDADIHFAGGSTDSGNVISGEADIHFDKNTLEFKGDDAAEANAMYSDIVTTIETSAPITGTASAQIVFKGPAGDRVVDVEFSTLDYDGKLYLFAELGDGTALVWTKAKK